MDILRKLGALAFASRLKRLSDQLYRDVSLIYDKCDCDFEARWFPVLYALKEKATMSITALASELRLTHPAINQIAEDLQKKNLIISKRGRKDRRQRFLKLSTQGKKLVKELSPVWKTIDTETKKLLKTTSSNMLVTITKIEQELDKKGMYERIIPKIKQIQYDKIKIIGYKPHYKKYFKSLNEEWLKKYFKLEQYDRNLLNDPNQNILKTGGFILFALLEKEVIGTVAMIKHSPGIYELAKMAVTEKHQGKQAGRKLADIALKKAKQRKAKQIFLMTSPKLKKASNLYSEIGFNKVNKPPVELPEFERCSIPMLLKYRK